VVARKFLLATQTYKSKLAPQVYIAAMLSQFDILVRILDSAIKYEICWYCGFVLKT
jgi:hypothetical protein